MRPSEMRTMSRTPLRSTFGGNSHVADFGKSRVAQRTAILQHHDAGLVDIERLVGDAGVVVFDILEHHGTAAVPHQAGRCRRRLDDGPVRREVAAQHGYAAAFGKRLVEGAGWTSLVPVARVLDAVTHRAAGDGEAHRGANAPPRQQSHHHGQTAGVVEVLHQELARRLEMDDGRECRGPGGPSRRAGCPRRRGPAMARRWTTALVEPPIAPLTRMAFSNASRVSIFDSANPPSPCRRCAGRRCWRGRCGASRRQESPHWQVGRYRATRPSRPSSMPCPSSCSGRANVTSPPRPP